MKKFWQHKFFVSIAFSETSIARGFYLRVSYCFLAVFIVSLSSFLAYSQYSSAVQAAMIKSGEVPAFMQSKIQRLEEDKKAQENKIHMFAQELGVIQAKLDRFDAIGEKLFSDPTLNEQLKGHEQHFHEHYDEDEDELSGKGDVVAPRLDSIPSLDELQKQLGGIQDRADAIGAVMDAGMKVLATQQIEKSQKPYLWPLMHHKSYISSSFGYRRDPFGNKKRFHGGTDFVAPRGSPIVSAGDGIVVFAGYRYNYGITVEIRHAHGFTSRYAHMQEATVQNGQSLKAGDLIGKLGSTGRSTGPHLHFEVLVDDVKVDPYPFVKDSKDYAQAKARDAAFQNQLNKKPFVK